MHANSKTLLLIGSGRLAQHLRHYLRSLDLDVHTWSRREDAPERLPEVVERATHVLFAIRDEALAEFSQPFLHSGRMLVHFSGAAVIEGVHAAHPLMTFGAQLQPAEWYRSIPFVHDTGTSLAELLPGLPNIGYPLAPEKRALYHALCALAGNSAFLLWQNIGARFETELGLPRTLLQPYLRQTVENAGAGHARDFTGPVARGDWATVRRHLEVLPAALAASYKTYLDLAARSGYPIPEDLR